MSNRSSDQVEKSMELPISLDLFMAFFSSVYAQKTE